MIHSLTRRLIAFLIAVTGLCQFADAQIIEHYAGTAGYSGWYGDGMDAKLAELNNPIDIATDFDGNVYVADRNNHAIRKITPNGIIFTIAGNPTPGYSGDGGLAVMANLRSPVAVAVDAAGNIYIADQGNAVIRKITTDGMISTFAGNGTEGYSGDGGAALAAELDLRNADMIIDGDGNVIVSHPESYVVRKITTAGIITTIAGDGVQGYSGDDGPATDAQFKAPRYLANGPAGSFYISDPKSHTIRKVDEDGIVTLFAGIQVNGYSGDGGLAINAKLGAPYGVTRDNCNNVYVAEYNNSVIRKIDPNGIITTIAGNSIRGTAGDGGAATSANLWYPMSVATDVRGHLYMTDAFNHRLRIMTVDACSNVRIQDPGRLCTLNTEKTINYTTSAGCTLEPEWTFDESHVKFISSTAGEAIFQFTQAGPAQLIATINTECNSYADTMWVQVDAAPADLWLGNDTTLCPGDSLVLKPGENYVQYVWQDGSSETSFTAKATGTYRVYVSNTCGELSSDDIDVSIEPLPELFTITSLAPCAGDTIKVAANNSYQYYHWEVTTADGDYFTSEYAKATTALSASTALILHATAASSCIVKDTIMVDVLRARTVKLGEDTSICYDAFITFAAGAGYKSYKWSDGSADSDLKTNIPGDYSVVVQDMNGCYTQDSISLNKYNRPLVNLGKDRNICYNMPVTLYPGHFESYLWHDGSKETKLDVKVPGTYWVNVIDENNCSAYDTMVIQSLLPSPSSFIKKADSVCAGKTIDVIAASGYQSYSWSTGPTTSRIIVSKPGDYALTVVDNNGCQATETIKISEQNCSKGVFMPNAFTPNNDGHNDKFRAVIHGPLVKFSLIVFNRYGEMVFSSTDATKPWDGLHKGRPAETGNYVWRCVYQLEGEAQAEQKGSMLLIR